MNEENSNTQTTPVANPPATGPDAVALQAKIVELEKQSEGRLRDLQSERAKRQELETKLTPVPVVNNETAADELGKVLNPYIAPVMARVKQAEAFVADTYRSKALEHLASKTGKSKEAVLVDTELGNKMDSIIKRFGFTGNLYDVTVKACEIMDLENLKAKEAERQRVVTANAGSSLPSGTNPPPVANAKEYSEEDFTDMPMHEYEKLSNSGTFLQNKEGKIVFTPRPT